MKKILIFRLKDFKAFEPFKVQKLIPAKEDAFVI